MKKLKGSVIPYGRRFDEIENKEDFFEFNLCLVKIALETSGKYQDMCQLCIDLFEKSRKGIDTFWESFEIRKTLQFQAVENSVDSRSASFICSVFNRMSIATKFENTTYEQLREQSEYFLALFNSLQRFITRQYGEPKDA